MIPVNSVLRLLPAAFWGDFPAPWAAAAMPAAAVLSVPPPPLLLLLLVLAKLALRAAALLLAMEGAAGEGGMLAPAIAHTPPHVLKQVPKRATSRPSCCNSPPTTVPQCEEPASAAAVPEKQVATAGVQLCFEPAVVPKQATAPARTQGLKWSTCPRGLLLLLLLLLDLLGAVRPGLIEAAQPNDQERQPHSRRAILCEGGHQRREAVLHSARPISGTLCNGHSAGTLKLWKGHGANSSSAQQESLTQLQLRASDFVDRCWGGEA